MQQVPPQTSKVVTAHERETIEVFLTQTDIILRREDTGGAYCLYELIAQPGEGTRKHIHSHEDEALYVLEGEFQVQCGERDSLLHPGDTISLPKGVPHLFTNSGHTPGRLLGIATPAGLERFFEEIGDLFKRGEATRERLLPVCNTYGIEYIHEA